MTAFLERATKSGSLKNALDRSSPNQDGYWNTS
jgi:hypothetical protein